MYRPGQLFQHLTGIVTAAEATSPRGNDLLTNRRLAMWSCSQLITTLKAASQPLAAGVMNEGVMHWRLALASSLAFAAGPAVLIKARGGVLERQGQSGSGGAAYSCVTGCGVFQAGVALLPT
jgi:hypothetical protein